MKTKRKTTWTPSTDPSVQNTWASLRNALATVLLPASLTVEKAAYFLQCSPREVALLHQAKLIQYLGHPKANMVRYIHTATLFELMADPVWMSEVRDAIYEFHRERNQKQKASKKRSGA